MDQSGLQAQCQVIINFVINIYPFVVFPCGTDFLELSKCPGQQGQKETRFALAKGYHRPPKRPFPMYFLIKLEAIRQYIHLFPGTFYHLHFHIKFAAFNHWVNVFALLIHFHLVTSTVFFVHLHTVIGLIRGKFLLQFVKKETPAQQQQGCKITLVYIQGNECSKVLICLTANKANKKCQTTAITFSRAKHRPQSLDTPLTGVRLTLRAFRILNWQD